MGVGSLANTVGHDLAKAIDVDFVKTDKDGKPLETDYAGFGIVGRALGMRMAQHIRKKTV